MYVISSLCVSFRQEAYIDPAYSSSLSVADVLMALAARPSGNATSATTNTRTLLKILFISLQ